MGIFSKIFSGDEVAEKINRAAEVYKLNRFDEAIESYSSALAIENENTKALYGRGLAYAKKGELNSALTDFKNVVRIDKDFSPNCFFHLAETLFKLKNNTEALESVNIFILKTEKKGHGYFLRGKIFYELGKYDDALKDAEKASELQPDEAEIFVLLGKIKIRLNEFRQAIIVLKKSLELNNDCDYAHTFLGGAYIFIHKKDEAENELKQVAKPIKETFFYFSKVHFANNDFEKSLDALGDALSFDENYIDAYFQRIEVYRELNETGKALEDLQKVIALQPDNIENIMLSAELNKLNNDFKSCVRDYNKVLRLDPDNVKALFELGALSSKTKNHEIALMYFLRVVELDDSFKEAFFELGKIYFTLEEYQKAINSFSSAISIDEKYFSAYYHRAKVKEILKDQQGALGDFTRALGNAEFYEAFIDRAKLKIGSGEFHSAINDLIKAVKLKGEKDYPHYLLASCYSKTDKEFDAMRSISTALDLKPTRGEYFYFRGMLYFDSQKYSEALADWAQALKLAPQYKSKLELLIQRAKSKVSS
ncbi:MAG: tetratricopeptide repeat protein [Chlorobi bacterium]|nr:tetratricopeptide repeat protein [Chlorobiota bacterium]